MTGQLIAVVDDEPHIVDMVCSFLQMKGYAVCRGYSGEDALIVVQTEQPDALLLDLMLPDIEGFEVIERLRADPALAALPVMVITARTDTDARRRAEHVGATGFLTKPIRMQELLAELARILPA